MSKTVRFVTTQKIICHIFVTPGWSLYVTIFNMNLKIIRFAVKDEVFLGVKGQVFLANTIIVRFKGIVFKKMKNLLTTSPLKSSSFVILSR